MKIYTFAVFYFETKDSKLSGNIITKIENSSKHYNNYMAGINFNKYLTYRNKIVFISVSSIICLVSIIGFDMLVNRLAEKEINEVDLWSKVMTSMSSDRPEFYYMMEMNSIRDKIINRNTSIPCIITNTNLEVMTSANIPDKILADSALVRRAIYNMANNNETIEIVRFDGMKFYVFYGTSNVINTLRYFPVIIFIVIFIFFVLAYITYNSSKQDEQNKVWIGMAKETAHQLGTPTSSLLGWLEYMKSQDGDPVVISEMTKDINRLLVVIERFSKIGSDTNIEPLNITEIVASTVTYFQPRIPKKVTLNYESKEELPLIANANFVLFGWVIENLLRNAVDALSGAGKIEVSSYSDKRWIYVDVKDNGKGIASVNFDNIFKPGFTTKSRGWGLGLSLSYRIVEEYHKGRIFVAESTIDQGTTIRIKLKKL